MSLAEGIICGGWKQSFQLMHFINCCGKHSECSESHPESASILRQNVYVFKNTSVNIIALQGHGQVEDIVTRHVAFSGLPADLLSSKEKVFLHDEE